MTKIKITERPMCFQATIYRNGEKLGQHTIMKPAQDCAAGWTERGHAKTAKEAKDIAHRWAFGQETTA
jgi:hypothetical protein